MRIGKLISILIITFLCQNAAFSRPEKDTILRAPVNGSVRMKKAIDRLGVTLSPEGRGNNILELFSHEPTIREVQNAAIEYAEVNPDKIKNWRKHAKFKAFLPEFSLDYDKTITYDSGVDRYYIGPSDWGASVKWDLGEIIWNPDQTSIDVRSKLMVQPIPSCVHGLSL